MVDSFFRVGASPSTAIDIDLDIDSPPLADVSNAISHKRKTRTSARVAAAAAAIAIHSSSESSEQSSLKPRRKRVTRVTTTIEILDSDEDVKVGTARDVDATTTINRNDENITHDRLNNDDNDIMSIDEYQSIPGTTYSDDFRSCHSSPDGQMDWEYMNEGNDVADDECAKMAGMASTSEHTTTATYTTANVEGKSAGNVEQKVSTRTGSKTERSLSNILYLVCIQGPHIGQSVPIKSTTIVGRGTFSQIKAKGKKDVFSVEKDDHVSTSHVKLVLCRKEEGKGNFSSLRVSDLGNDDYSVSVNGKSIKKGGSGKQVFIGNKIQIGQCLFVVSKKSN